MPEYNVPFAELCVVLLLCVGLDACVRVYSRRMRLKMPAVRGCVLPVTMWVVYVFGEMMPAGRSTDISRMGGRLRQVWSGQDGRFTSSYIRVEVYARASLEYYHYGSMYKRLRTVNMLYDTVYAVRECVWSSWRNYCERESAGARSSNIYPPAESEKREKQGHVRKRSFGVLANSKYLLKMCVHSLVPPAKTRV